MVGKISGAFLNVELTMECSNESAKSSTASSLTAAYGDAANGK